MRKLSYGMNVSLDGYIEAPNGDLSWSGPDEELHRHFNDLDASTGETFYGRRLYETMSAFWPTAEGEPDAPDYVKEYARIWLAKRKLVFSTTLKKVDWNSELVRGDMAEEVRKVKAQPGKELTVAGAGLAASFMQLGLVDEYRLYIHPVILGAGKRMFGSLPQPVNLRLVDTHKFSGGVIMLKYEAVQ